MGGSSGGGGLSKTRFKLLLWFIPALLFLMTLTIIHRDTHALHESSLNQQKESRQKGIKNSQNRRLEGTDGLQENDLIHRNKDFLSMDNGGSGEIPSSSLDKKPTFDDTSYLNAKSDEERSEAVKKAMEFAFDSYSYTCWGKDELLPLTKTCEEWLRQGATIIDSISTLYIMGLTDQYKKAKKFVEDELNFDSKTNNYQSFFETTIRMLGGLNSAHALTGEKIFFDKAFDLASRMLNGFSNSKYGFPYGRYDVSKREGRFGNNGQIVLAEIGTLQIEFTYVAVQSGDKRFSEKVLSIFKLLNDVEKTNKLYPSYLRVSHFDNNKLPGTPISMGPMADSFYEYLLKMWLFTDKKVPLFRKMYDEAMEGMINCCYTHNNVENENDKLWFFGDKNGMSVSHKMDHLACFSGGMFALGAQGNTKERDLAIAKNITKTCHENYVRNPTRIGAETFSFHGRTGEYNPSNPVYILRPETVESYFVLNRVTGDDMYKEWAWDAFLAIQKHCKTENGYSGLRNVGKLPAVNNNKQESFFLAETLKYLYLIFTDKMPLDEYVFNTEAHPVPKLQGKDFDNWKNHFQMLL